MSRFTREVLRKRREIQNMKNEYPPDITGTFEALNNMIVFGRLDELYNIANSDATTYDLKNPLVVEKAVFYGKQEGIFVELNTYLSLSKDDPDSPNTTLSDDPRHNLIGIWERAGRTGSGTEWVLHLANHSYDNGVWTIRAIKVDNENMVEEIEAIYVESGKDATRIGMFTALGQSITVEPTKSQYPCLIYAKASRKKLDIIENHEDSDGTEHHRGDSGSDERGDQRGSD